MSSINLSFSDEMSGFIKSRVEGGDFHDEVEYIHDLVRQDQERLANEDALEKALLEAEAGGFVETSVLDIMKEVEARMRANGEL